MTSDDFSILIGGEAGQGLVTAGTILAKALMRSGLGVLVTQSYESRIRGGHNTFAIRCAPRPVIAPRETVDLLLALTGDTVGIHQGQMTARGRMIVDTAHGAAESDSCVAVPFKELADKRMFTMAATGVAAALLGLERTLMGQTVNDVLGTKHPELTEANQKVLTDAYEWVGQNGFPKLGPPSARNRSRRMLMDGNEALAAGAISAGVRFCSYYPMTPGSSIMQAMITHAKHVGVMVEQAEDEIAAINMAIGASYAGAPSMVSTSGGGFALMVEGVSLAAMTETPVVVVVAQRPGPATGLPTRTEQADLEFVLHSGHGEFPRALFAPGDVEECFHLTRKAFELSEKYQGPMFVLTDQFLADSLRSAEPFDAANLQTVAPLIASADVPGPYKRYAITDAGVSPRLVPCETPHLVIADSDEHDEEGHLTEDLGIRVRMVDKRLRKGRGICGEVVRPGHTGDDSPDLLLVGWGSTKGSMEEAAAVLRGRGQSVGTLHFSQVWPLVGDLFVPQLEKAGQVVCIESNATAQFARLIRRETGFHISRRILRYDGLPITPEYILRELEALECT
ncbi:MAG TPA: 2-oxoacid:acceptor oxidoreductase subunit alpha [Phycisphaerae bacterium]|nr:2-oxoacid:acceptor oxidoreductase subunit alpha [Phycisphaerae bacterium]HRR84928.1 2-oxoacid:acceptor oxidoreductase subunit alpha [Phycisphaerae bacterium]